MKRRGATTRGTDISLAAVLLPAARVLNYNDDNITKESVLYGERKKKPCAIIIFDPPLSADM